MTSQWHINLAQDQHLYIHIYIYTAKLNRPENPCLGELRWVPFVLLSLPNAAYYEALCSKDGRSGELRLVPFVLFSSIHSNGRSGQLRLGHFVFLDSKKGRWGSPAGFMDAFGERPSFEAPFGVPFHVVN